jgi:hypothetical protein
VWNAQGLTGGEHTVSVSYTGRSNSSATGRIVNVDAFSVVD